jgi:hypothetical protein
LSLLYYLAFSVPALVFSCRSALLRELTCKFPAPFYSPRSAL